MTGLFDPRRPSGLREDLRAAVLAVSLVLLAVSTIVPASLPWGARPGGSARAAQRETGRPADSELNRNTMLAERLIRDGRIEEAAVLLEKLLEDYPDAKTVIEKLSGCYLRTGRPEDAITLLKKGLRLYPGTFGMMRAMGYAYLDMGDRRRAADSWELILDGEGRNIAYYGVVAKLERDAGMYERAMETLKAGRRYERYYSRYTMEIVQLERIMGDDLSAFMEGLEYLSSLAKTSVDQAGFLFVIFSDAGERADMLAAVDSLAALEDRRSSYFGMIHALLLVMDGRYDDVDRYFDSGDERFLTRAGMESFLGYASGMSEAGADPVFDRFLDAVTGVYLGMYGGSSGAPRVLMLAAARQRRQAVSLSPPDSAKLEDALSKVYSVVYDPDAAMHADAAACLGASILADELFRPKEALRLLDAVEWHDEVLARRALEIRVRALLSSGMWERAEKELSILASDPDPERSVIGRYGLGRLLFLTGRYSQAVDTLAGLAEEYSWSEWSNDALETAMIIKGSAGEEGGALDLYRSALYESSRGGNHAAVDSLGALMSGYPDSSLLPRALYMRARIGERLGRLDKAETDLGSLAERFPMHELAPRALERLGALAERDDPEAAVQRYREIIERYPDDPFLERVRERYIALRGSLDGKSGEGEGER